MVTYQLYYVGRYLAHQGRLIESPTHAGRFGQSLKPRTHWQVSGARKNTILSTRSRSAHNVANRKRYLFTGL